MGNPLRILLLEDLAADAELAIRTMRQEGIEIECRRVETKADFLRQIEEFRPHLVLSDFTLPAFDGLAALSLVRERYPDLPFIFVSGTIGEERAIEALKHGATDYVLKANLARLPSSVRRALRDAEDLRRRKRQEEKIARLSRIHAVFSGINSAVVRIHDRRELFQEACRIAVEHGQFRMAWVGLASAGMTKLDPVAWHGYNDGYLDEVASRLSGVPEDSGIGGQALRERRVFVVNDIATDERVLFKEEALARGYRSLAALPLFVETEIVAVFLIFAADVGVFDHEEMKLLTELASDVSFALEYIAKEEKLNYLAYYDVLTGLANRNLLKDRLKQALAHANRLDRIVAAVFVDLDRFKLINDGVGHGAGDRLLKEVGARLLACAREGDTVARLGGDEFALVLLDLPNAESVSPVVQRALEAVSQPIHVPDQEFNVTCSIGVALYPQDGKNVETLLSNAEAAMYRAKELGRGNFQLFAKEMNAKISERLLVEGNLRYAIERRELSLHYQPRIDLRSGRIIGAEALLRWESGKVGPVSPDKFIPIAEESGLIVPIGEWVIRQACAQNKAWQGRGLPPICISVNLSARQFRQRGLPQLIAAALDETRLDPGCLELELTESMMMHNVELAVGTLRDLKAMGVELSIDDFGTGYSSLSYLKRFSVGRLKIDQSFVRDIASDPDDAAIAQAVISLGHSLGLKVTAEGVETEEQLAFLKGSGCDEAQGYYLGRPMSPAEFESLLANGKPCRSLRNSPANEPRSGPRLRHSRAGRGRDSY
jgi:diguanylate cyclase (GGDEF)-like protein